MTILVNNEHYLVSLQLGVREFLECAKNIFFGFASTSTPIHMMHLSEQQEKEWAAAAVSAELFHKDAKRLQTTEVQLPPLTNLLLRLKLSV